MAASWCGWATADGTLRSPARYKPPTVKPGSLAVGDFNGDGQHLDLVVGNLFRASPVSEWGVPSPPLRLQLRPLFSWANGDGHHSVPPSRPIQKLTPSPMAIGDFKRRRPGWIWPSAGFGCWLGLGRRGRLSEPEQSPYDGGIICLVCGPVGDFNGDGKTPGPSYLSLFPTAGISVVVGPG